MSHVTKISTLAVLKLGKLSTQFYLKQLRQLKLSLIDTNFELINANLPNNFTQLESLLRPYLSQLLNDNSIDSILVPNITLHETLDRLHADFPLPYIHPVKTTIEAVKQHGYNDVMLMGSWYSMNAPYIQNSFERHNINVLKPTDDEQTTIDNYRKKIYAGSATQCDNRLFSNLLSKYQRQVAVIIACTELSAALPMHIRQYPYHCFDMASIQIKNALIAHTDSLNTNSQ